MSAAKFTPGPWVQHPSFPWIIKQDQRPIADAEDGVTVCNTTAHEGGGFFPTPEEGRANARLIAAAPELLEALQDMHEVLREAMSTGGWVPTPVQDSFRDAWFSMTAAMTKATGGEA